jgi:hypothetical protein
MGKWVSTGRRVLTGVNESFAIVDGFTTVSDGLEASYSGEPCTMRHDLPLRENKSSTRAALSPEGGRGGGGIPSTSSGGQLQAPKT